jgi:hypothetical protein
MRFPIAIVYSSYFTFKPNDIIKLGSTKEERELAYLCTSLCFSKVVRVLDNETLNNTSTNSCLLNEMYIFYIFKEHWFSQGFVFTLNIFIHK